MKDALRKQLHTIFFDGLIPDNSIKHDNVYIHPGQTFIKVNMSSRISRKWIMIISNKLGIHVLMADQLVEHEGKPITLASTQVYRLYDDGPHFPRAVRPVSTEEHIPCLLNVVKELHANLAH